MGEYYYNELGDTTLYVYFEESSTKKSLKIVAKKFNYYRQGISDVLQVWNRELIAYPNPFEHSMNIILPEGEIPEYLEIFNVSGRLVRRATGSSLNNIHVKRENLLPGMYIIRVKGKNNFSGSVLVK